MKRWRNGAENDSLGWEGWVEPGAHKGRLGWFELGVLMALHWFGSVRWSNRADFSQKVRVGIAMHGGAGGSLLQRPSFPAPCWQARGRGNGVRSLPQLGNPLPTLWRDAHGCKATVLPRSTLPVTAVKRLTCGPRWHNSPDVVGGQSGAKPSTSDWHLTRGRLLMTIGSCPAVIMRSFCPRGGQGEPAKDGPWSTRWCYPDPLCLPPQFKCMNGGPRWHN